ncbi:MAG: hypothetical protein II595_05100 [Desulfovibrio sp.]|nr:hypothetical protein [Desulfovibrio sp.]
MTRLFPAPALTGPGHIAKACLPAACLVLACALAGCAPQDIATGSSERADRDYYKPDGPSAQDALRLPMPASGSGKERYLYYASQPTVMENMQNWNRQRLYGNGQGNAQAERDRLLSAPKQRSPFRQ